MAVDYISALNAGSGLNTTQIIDSLIDAEKAPKAAAIQEKIDDADIAISSLGLLKTELSTFNSNVNSLAGQNGITLSSSSSSIIVEKTGTNPLTSFNHSIAVSSLAEQQVLEFSGFSSATDPISLGNLTFTVGTWDSSISSFSANSDYTAHSLDVSSASTIADVVSIINNSTDTALAGIQASILQTNDNSFSVVIKSHFGEDRELHIVDSAGSTFEFSSSTDASHQISGGVNAALTVDGISVSRNTNIITDLLDDMSVEITATTTATQTVSAEYDKASALTTMKGIVEELNFVLTFLETETASGENGADDGGLYGDPFANSLKNIVRSFTASPIEGFNSENIYLSYFGVLTNRDGTLSLDEDKFSTYFTAYPDHFSALTQSRATTDNAAVSASINGDYFTPGTYSLDIQSSVGQIEDSDGNKTDLSGSSTTYIASSGGAIGLNLETSSTSTTATVYMGRSFIDTISNYFDGILASNSDIDTKLQTLGINKTDFAVELEDLESRMASKREVYQGQFGAMEGTVASFKKTGDYMTNFMESWRAGLG
jgi:flagellar hook-associated protein 2